MVELLTVMVTAMTAVAAAVITAYRKPPEVKLLDLQKVMREVARSEVDRDRVQKEIDKQLRKIGTVDYAWWLLMWAAGGALVVAVAAAVLAEEKSPEVASVLAVVGLIYLVGFVLFLVASLEPVLKVMFQGARRLFRNLGTVR